MKSERLGSFGAGARRRPPPALLALAPLALVLADARPPHSLHVLLAPLALLLAETRARLLALAPLALVLADSPKVIEARSASLWPLFEAAVASGISVIKALTEGLAGNGMKPSWA